MNGFVHLHLHSEYSLLDGACRINELIKKVKDIGQKAVAITDHGVMYGAIDFYKEAKKNGIKPIIGCEVYVAKRTRFDKVYELDSENSHLVLLCKNNIGYQNLIKMVSSSFVDGFYNKPRVDEKLLAENSEGLIALSACLAGEIPKLLIENDYNEAKEKALKYNKIFGEGNFYLELQDHGLKEQKYINPMIINISKETGIPLVATNDCHYIEKEDSKMHEILLCIQTNHTIEDENRMKFSSDQFYLKTEEEMRENFPLLDEAYENTIKISEKCNVEFEFGNTKLPNFDVPDNKEHFEYFKDKCYEGLYKIYGKEAEESLIRRLEYELNTIKTMGYVDYYLIVYDFVRYAKSVGIKVGPGRGSGAGSLAAFCIGITEIDPIKYNLLFERFLNPERVSMPDFDIDFCYERRQEVINYVINKYGKDHVAQIVTFGTMAARGSIRDVGRALGIPYSKVDEISKLIPMELGMTIDKAIKSSNELKSKYDSDEKIHELIDMAKKIEGMPRHTSTHAAGVVITKQKVEDYVPLAKNDESIITQYTMTRLEELGLLKMDFLGLRTLTVIHDAEKMIRKSDPNFCIENINEEDKNVFNMISKGDTEGVFQFESPGMRNVLMQLKPENIEDLIAVISLYRPGPMDSIPEYIKNRHNPDNIKYKHPLLSDILDVTYGCIVYQEQVMQIFRTLAGYSLGRADIVRRAMSKKKADVMEREHQIFINGLVDENGNVEVEGCLRRGIDKKTADKIYSEMQNFASYAFNKSHAAAYALISYRTAFLKCNYTKEYMAAILTSVLDNNNKVSRYILACEQMNIKVLPPHVNESDLGFIVSYENIRFGLLAIKNLGRNFLNSLILERNTNGKFISFYDFCKRMYGKDMNRKTLESLIKCGALDNLLSNRHKMLETMDSVLDNLDSSKRKNIDGQLGFFDNNVDDFKWDKTPNVEEFPIDYLLKMEKETTGMYLSSHPMAEYSSLAKKINAAKILDILNANDNKEYIDGKRVTVLAIISSIKLKTTKNNSTMAFVNIEDMSGTLEMVVFPKVLIENSKLLKENNIVKIKARVNIREEEEPKLICESIGLPLESKDDLEKEDTKNKNNKNTAKKGLYIKIPSKESVKYKKAETLISIFEGRTQVYFFFEDTKKLMLAPSNLWVDINDVLLKELENQIGEKNIVLKS